MPLIANTHARVQDAARRVAISNRRVARAAPSTATVTRLESRRTSRRDGAYSLQVLRELHTIPAERNVFLDFYDRFAVLSPNIPGNCDDLPKHSKLSGITIQLRGIRYEIYGDLSRN